MTYPTCQTSTLWRGPRRSVLTGMAALAAMPAVAQGQSADLVTAANKEGNLFIYGDDVHLPPLIAGFSKQYSDIRVQFASYGGWGSYQRWVMEEKAGRAVASLIYTGEDALQAGSNVNDFARYKPTTPGLADWAIRDGGAYTLVHGVILGIIYNTSAIGTAPLPEDWMDFSAPPSAWKDLIIFADPRASSLSYALVAAFYQDFGPDKGAQLFSGLKKSGVEVSPNAGPQTAKMMSGERPLTLTLHSGYLAAMLSQGAPVKQIIPASGANPQYVGMSITKNAPHPNAARLFLEYTVSPAGQAALVAVGVYGTRVDARTPKGMPPLNSVKQLPTNLKQAIVDRDKILAWWKQASGIE